MSPGVKSWLNLSFTRSGESNVPDKFSEHLRFKCPKCGNKTISFYNKWRTSQRNPLTCKVCRSGYHKLNFINGVYSAIVSLLYPCLIIYFIFIFTLKTGLLAFGTIIFTEILVALVTPLATKISQKTTLP